MGLSSKLVVSWDGGIGDDDRDQSGASSAKMKRQPSQVRGEAVKCPRCDSTNTKFCYYNNYNKSQPRHFCRACKRHWTKGGTLRNVPVGGGRKNKRSKKSSPDDQPRLQLGNASGEDRDEKSTVSEILYRAVTARPPAMLVPSFAELQSGLSLGPEFDGTVFNTSTVTSALAFPQTLRLVSCTSSPFESSLSSISSSFQTAEYNGEDRIGKAIAGDHMSTMAPSPWKQVAETPSYDWSFEDIDTLVSSDHIHLPWDESLQIDQP